MAWSAAGLRLPKLSGEGLAAWPHGESRELQV